MTQLSENEIRYRLDKLIGWYFLDNQIFRDYQFKDFKEALVFVNKIGNEAEAMDHHPDIVLHSWNKVKISISTHSEGGITDKDFLLAEKIELLK